ncbi:MAG: PHP domain-containing protein [Polyangiaceae bacterium]
MKSRPLVLLALLMGVLSLPHLASCVGAAPILRAKRIENRSELIGGPVAMADIGDFLIENDMMRVAILRAVDSPGPGVHGGSIIDVDIRRPSIDMESGHGRDRFAETFPIANLLVPEPDTVDIRVLKDGSDEKEAVIRVEGDGTFLFKALGVIRSHQPALELFFPDLKTQIHFRTDYILRPGARHLLMRTVLTLLDDPPSGCPPTTSCTQNCPYGLAHGDDGCPICECSDVLPLEKYTGPAGVFSGMLGDSPDEEGATYRAGIIAGDFVFFGNQNDVFAPGPGFDEDTSVQDAAVLGRNTFQHPLVFDFVAAAGGDVSYGYFTVPEAGEPKSVVAVPMFANAATTFLTGRKNCLLSTDDDASCDRNRAFRYERYLAVGEGDIASVTEEMYRVRGIETGKLRGQVRWAHDGTPVKNARLFVFHDPTPGTDFASVDQLIDANRTLRGDVGLVNAIDADRGLDPNEDGRFEAKLSPGSYVIVARDPEASATSKPLSVRIEAGADEILGFQLLEPASISYNVRNESGEPIPAKLALISLDDKGRPLETDGRRRPSMGEGRLGNGRQAIALTADGHGSMRVPPGRYELLVSRGPEYGMHRESDFVLSHGQHMHVEAVLPHEIDTRGWMSADMHLHSTPSFDSGMPIARRVISAVAEGVEFAVSTDHDVHTDYEPTVRALGLATHIRTAVGAEITTLEQGHFIGFPLRYDKLVGPTHGAHDWTCESASEILDGIRDTGDEIEPLTIMAHPRDGFFGYIEQLGVDAYQMTRSPSILEAQNSVFRTADCSVDAMEIMGAKRLDLTRTPSVSEVIDWNRCSVRMQIAESIEELALACPEMGEGLVAPCPPAERLLDCKRRNRTALAWSITKRVLARSPTEQFANWSFTGTAAESQVYCDLDDLGSKPVPQGFHDVPCTHRAGQVDDFFRFLDRGFLPTQVGSSDSHNPRKEPGYARTYFRSSTDSPGGLKIADAVSSIRGGHALATTGPFVRATIKKKTFGEVVQSKPGQALAMALDVQTASWFGVDRVEVYLNGELLRLILPNKPPEAIFDVHGKVSFEVPNRDSWVVVIAMGLKPGNTMEPIWLDVPFGEIQLAVVARDAFSRIPVINDLFPPSLTVPDWSPIPAYAITNPIYIDTDGNGRYDAPLPPPAFCSRPCNASDPDACPDGQVCLSPEKVCGIAISGGCQRREARGHSH